MRRRRPVPLTSVRETRRLKIGPLTVERNCSSSTALRVRPSGGYNSPTGKQRQEQTPIPDAKHPPHKVGGSDRGPLVAFTVGHRDGGPPNNLPLEFSSFVGREKELAEVERLLVNSGTKSMASFARTRFGSSIRLVRNLRTWSIPKREDR